MGQRGNKSQVHSFKSKTFLFWKSDEGQTLQWRRAVATYFRTEVCLTHIFWLYLDIQTIHLIDIATTNRNFYLGLDRATLMHISGKLSMVSQQLILNLADLLIHQPFFNSILGSKTNKKRTSQDYKDQHQNLIE